MMDVYKPREEASEWKLACQHFNLWLSSLQNNEKFLLFSHPVCTIDILLWQTKLMQRDNERFVISFLFFVTVVTIIFVYSLLLLLLSHFSHVQPHRRQPTRLPRPWGSPGKNTGVGCHFLLQCMKVKSEREVAQSYLTLSDPMDCSLPGSFVHGIFQASTRVGCHCLLRQSPSTYGKSDAKQTI